MGKEKNYGAKDLLDQFDSIKSNSDENNNVYDAESLLRQYGDELQPKAPEVPGGGVPTGKESGGFLDALREGFGEDEVGPSKRTRAALESSGPVGLFNKYAVEPAMTAGEFALRGANAIWHGGANLAGKAVNTISGMAGLPGTGEKLEKDINAIPEAFPMGFPEGTAAKIPESVLKELRRASQELRTSSGIPSSVEGVRARRLIGKVLPGGVNIQDQPNRFVPGFNPTTSQLTGNAAVANLEKQVVPSEEMSARNAGNQQAILSLADKLAPRVDTGPAVMAPQQTLRDARMEAASEAVSMAKEDTRNALGSIATSAADQSASDISRAISTNLVGNYQTKKKAISDAWTGLGLKNVQATVAGGFKQAVANFKRDAGYLDDAQGQLKGQDLAVLKPFTDMIEGTKKNPGWGDVVPFSELQTFRSKILSAARDTDNANDSRILNNFANTILDASKPVANAATPGLGDKWQSVIDATKQFHQDYGNKAIGSIFEDTADQSTSGALMDRLFGGAKKSDTMAALKKIAPSADGTGLEPVISNHISNWLAQKLDIDSVLRNPKNFDKFKSKYEDVFNSDPSIAKKFDSPTTAVQTYAGALQEERRVNDEISKSSLRKILGADPDDPKSVEIAFKSVLDSKTPASDAKQLINSMNGNADALSGARRTFVDLMLNKPDEIHTFIEKNRGVLDQFFTEPNQQKMMDQLTESSRAHNAPISSSGKANKVIANLQSDKNFLGALLGPVKAATAYTAAGTAAAGVGAAVVAGASKLGVPASLIGALAPSELFALWKSPEIVRSFYKADRDKVVDTIKDAFLNPETTGKMLLSPTSNDNVKKYAPRIMSGLINPDLIPQTAAVAGAINKKENQETSPRYSSGGAVYTPPAISDIRANRAKRSAVR